MRNGWGRATLLSAALAGLCALTACGSQSGGNTSTSTFHPSGSMAGQPSAAASTASGAVTMPAFGKNVHIDLTGTPPAGASASQVQAIKTDENYELAFLYAEYTSGQDTAWTSYVSSTMQTEVQNTLSQADVTGESFTGTIKIFDLAVVADPTVPADLDVSGCFDNAASANTSRATGKVIPATGSADQFYYRYTDQLAKDASGSWQVVSDLPAVYYPRAKECKP
jgi:hypothetical protein